MRSHLCNACATYVQFSNIFPAQRWNWVWNFDPWPNPTWSRYFWPVKLTQSPSVCALNWEIILMTGARGGCEQMSPLPLWGSGVRDPPKFLYILNTKSRILMHSLAPIMGTISVFIKTLCTGGKVAEWGPKGRKLRPKAERGVGFLGRGQQAPPARMPGSDVKKTKFLRPRPK